MMQNNISDRQNISEHKFEETTSLFLQSLKDGERVHPRSHGIEAFRQVARRLQLDHACHIPDSVVINNGEIAGRRGSIPIRTYQPQHEAGAGDCVVLYFHGGAWVLGGLDEYDGVCGSLSHAASCTVVSVDYRLAPEHKFPAAVEDCYDVASCVAADLNREGGGRRKLVVAGDSAGGNLAAVVCQEAKRKTGPQIDRQVLIYPCLAPYDPNKYPSRDEYGGPGNFLNEADFRFMLDQYIRRAEDEDDPRLWPILSHDLSGLPEAFILTAEFDMLRDEAKAYADALEAAQIRVVYKQYDGVIHGFVGVSGTVLPGRQALNEICEYLRQG